MSYEPWTLVGLHASVRFSLVADALPGLLPRLLQPFAKRDLNLPSDRINRCLVCLRVACWRSRNLSSAKLAMGQPRVWSVGSSCVVEDALSFFGSNFVERRLAVKWQ